MTLCQDYSYNAYLNVNLSNTILLFCSNVLSVLDQWCSGRQTCKLRVSLLLEFRKSCEEDLASYLQARYSCESGQCTMDILFYSVSILFMYAQYTIPESKLLIYYYIIRGRIVQLMQGRAVNYNN